MRRLVVGLVMLSACTGSGERFDVAVPDEIAWFTIVQPAPFRAGALFARAEHEALGFEELEGPAYVIGFEDDQIRPLLPARVETVEETALEAAEECEPSLPAPRWQQALVDGNEALTLPFLTADWVRDSRDCGGRDAFVVRCDGAPTPCDFTPRSDSSGSCERAYDSCPLFRPGTLTVERLGAGRACLDLAPVCSAESAEGDGVMARLGCTPSIGEGCTVELVEVQDRVLDLQRVQAITPSPGIPDLPIERGQLADTAIELPPLDLIALGDRLLLLESQSEDGLSRACDDAPPSSLQIRSGTDGSLVRRLDVPPCARRLVRDPTGPGFFVTAMTSSVTLELSRYDADGEALGTTAFDLSGWAPNPLWVSDLLARSDFPQLVLVIRDLQNVMERTQLLESSFLLLVDLSQGEPQLRFIHSETVPGETIRYQVVREHPNGDVLVVDDEQGIDLVRRFSIDLEGGQFVEEGRARQPDRPVAEMRDLFIHESTRIAILPDYGETRRLYLFKVDPNPELLSLTLFDEHNAAVTVVQSWPDDESLVSAFGFSTVDLKSHLGWFDPRTGDFLRESTVLGDGPVSQVVRSGDTLWALMPWTGEIVGIRP